MWLGIAGENRIFASDFKIVADYFVQMRKNKGYTAPQTVINHVHELLQLMSVMTKDNRYGETYSPDMEGGHITMCEVLDRIEKKGEDTILSLMDYLLSDNRIEDARKAIADETYRDELLSEIFPDENDK